VISHPCNLGYGSALLTGYLYARQHRYERVLQMDADGQHDPRSIGVLLDALGADADVAVGSRFLAGRPPRTSLARRLGSRLFAAIVTGWTGTRITDPTSGFQAMNARAVAELAHDGFPEDYPDADVLITLARAGMRLREVPVIMHPRAGGRSMHRGGRAAYYAYKMLLTLSLLPWRRRSTFRSGFPAAAAPASARS
jgi:glycosyltransferase involved in cell wall biosynthesis